MNLDKAKESLRSDLEALDTQFILQIAGMYIYYKSTVLEIDFQQEFQSAAASLTTRAEILDFTVNLMDDLYDISKTKEQLVDWLVQGYV